MSGLKDWTKVIIVALLTAISAQVIGRMFIKNDKIEDAATKTELKTATDEAKKESKCYTDEKFKVHDKKHEDEEKQRIERDALMYKYLDTRFKGIENLIENID